MVVDTTAEEAVIDMVVGEVDAVEDIVIIPTIIALVVHAVAEVEVVGEIDSEDRTRMRINKPI